MINRSLIQFTKCRIREFVREPSAMYFVILMPILWILVLGYAFNSDTKVSFPIGITKSAQTWKKPLADSGRFIIADSQDLRSDLQAGRIKLILDLGADSKPTFALDPRDPDAEHASLLVLQTLSAGTISSADVNVPSNVYVNFLVPGILALSLLSTSLFGTGMTIVANRRENLLKRYLTTPVRPELYVLSHLIGRTLIMCMEIAVIMLFSFLVFDFGVAGSWFSFLLTCFLATMSFAALSILIAARGKNTGAYNGIANLILVPMLILSGVWFSRTLFPNWLESLADFLPLAALVDSLRMIALEGQNFTWGPWAILLTWGGLFTTLAVKRFKWH